MVDFRKSAKRRQNDASEIDDRSAADEALFEQELRNVLRPLVAPEGFADRVVARAREISLQPVHSFSTRRPIFRWAVAAVLLLTIASGGYLEHQRARRIAGEHARQQVLLALRITSTTLQDVRNKVDSNPSN